MPFSGKLNKNFREPTTLTRNQSLGTFAKFSGKVTFLTLLPPPHPPCACRYTHVSFSENITNVLNESSFRGPYSETETP